MRASDFEFRYRFWIFAALFWIAFGCYRIDHENTGIWLLGHLAPRLDMNSPRARVDLQIVFAAGAALALLGAALRSWATAYLRSDVVHDGVVRADALVAEGPFRFVRNPLYLGTQLLMTGTALMTSRVGGIFLIAGGLVFHLRLIAREESALGDALGEPFRAYRARVPQFLPSLVPRVAGSGRAPRWKEALAAEGFFWLMGLAMIAFVFTLDVRVMGAAALAGVALYWSATSILRRRASAHRAG